MRLFASIGIILLVVVLQSHCQQDQDLTIGPTQQNLDQVSRSVTNLAQKISLAIASPKSKTELFSPVSIAGALSLLLLGSAGTTRDELINVLGFQGQSISFADIHKSFGRLFQELVSNDPTMTARIPWRENDKCNNPDYDEEEEQFYQPPPKVPNNQGSRGKRESDSHYISVANGVFVDQDLQLNPNYVNLTKTLYAGEISRKPLLRDPVQSSYEINKWVNHATRNKIREIVSPEQVSNAPMVLASALYFKAKWETMFIEPDTRPRPFYLNGRDRPPVDVYAMATSGCFPFYEDKQLDVKIIGLPYQTGKTTMYIFMPNQSDRQKIRLFQNRVHVSQLDELINRMVVKTGTIILPKMNLENSFGLKEALISNGLQHIFNPHLSNLTEITKEDRTYENGNRRSQPRPTTPSAKPTPSTQQTQDWNNANQNVQPPAPGNPSSQQTPPPLTSHFSAETAIARQLNEIECLQTNKCEFAGNVCNYSPYAPVYRDDKGCYLKPWNIEQNCPLERQGPKAGLCLVDSHVKYSAGQSGQCELNCRQVGSWCYCCKSHVDPAPQGTISPPSTEHQQNLNPPKPFQISNRFDSNDIRTPAPISTCFTRRICDGYQCSTHTICTRHVIPYTGNIGRRNKRQTQPNLYVGDVLHKVTLDVNEQGTEGGAVTAVVIDRISSAINVRVDGPFLIYLRNDVTKLPLFYGAVFDPRL